MPIPVTRLGIAGAAMAVIAVVAACGSSDSSTDGPPSDFDAGCTGFACADGDTTPCRGLECQRVTCEGGARTTVTGVVHDPAGKVPIFNAVVYIPNDAIAAVQEGASCDRCDAKITGAPVVVTTTDVNGRFTLDDVPVGTDVPLVVQIGKWRRETKISNVAKCTETKADDAITRLPRNRSEGHLPKIALATGGADPLQCLLRKIGIDDGEFGLDGEDARVHLYAGGGDTASTLASHGYSNGKKFPKADSFWGDAEKLKSYDLVLLGCEGIEIEQPFAACPTCSDGATKTTAAKAALYEYAKAGGRIFASHYHHVWFSSADAPNDMKQVASWNVPELQPPGSPPAPVDATISDAFDKAKAMQSWLAAQGALVNGKLPIVDARHNVQAVGTGGLGWITVPNDHAANAAATQYLTFNAPVGAAEDAVCGRVVFSNLHVASGAQDGKTDDPHADFPTGCNTTDLSPQQKALEYMLFDLASCVQRDEGAIQAPH